MEIDMILQILNVLKTFKIRNLEINVCHTPLDTSPSCSDLLKHLPGTLFFLFLYKCLPACGHDFP